MKISAVNVVVYKEGDEAAAAAALRLLPSIAVQVPVQLHVVPEVYREHDSIHLQLDLPLINLW